MIANAPVPKPADAPAVSRESEIANYVALWARQAGIDPLLLPQLCQNIPWFVSLSEKSQDREKINGFMDAFLLGAGKGRVCLLTLNEAIFDMRVKSVSQLDLATVERFFLYERGDEGGTKRNVSGTSKNGGFSVTTALRIGRTEQKRQVDALQAKKEEALQAQISSEMDASTLPLDKTMNGIISAHNIFTAKFYEVTTDTKNIALGEGVWEVMKAAFTQSIDGSSLQDIQQSYLAVNNAFGRFYLTYDEVRTAIRYGRMDLLPDATEKFAKAYAEYLSGLQKMQFKLEAYTFEGARAVVEGALFALDAVSLALIPAGVGGLVSGARQAGQAGLKATLKFLAKNSSRAFLESSGVALGMALLLNAYGESETDDINKALVKFQENSQEGIAMLSGIIEGLDEELSAKASRQPVLKEKLEAASKELEELQKTLSGRAPYDSDRAVGEFGRISLDVFIIDFTIRMISKTGRLR